MALTKTQVGKVTRVRDNKRIHWSCCSQTVCKCASTNHIIYCIVFRILEVSAHAQAAAYRS